MKSFILFIILSVVSVLNAFCAPLVLQPGGVAGYMYFPATITSSSSTVNSGSTSTPGIEEYLSNINPAIVVIDDALYNITKSGTCTKSLNVGDLCNWNDGIAFQYAGRYGTRYLFIIPMPHFSFVDGQGYSKDYQGISLDDGVYNTNIKLIQQALTTSNSYGYSSCLGNLAYVPSYQELNAVYLNKSSLGITNGNYISSSSSLVSDLNNPAGAYKIDFSTGVSSVVTIEASYYYMCMRYVI